MEPRELKQLSEEEERWLGWLDHPCTNLLRKWAGAKRFDYMSQWAMGDFISEPVVGAKAMGSCETLVDIMELDFTKISGELDDAKAMESAALAPAKEGG